MRKDEEQNFCQTGLELSRGRKAEELSYRTDVNIIVELPFCGLGKNLVPFS